ncbi:MAG: chlorophyll synthase ChlG [Caldilineaceae bacterium]|nr:chlorophyll synthase ChlG [Caldilineaceae bacterium]
MQQPRVLSRSLAIMKPVTWFGPTWAFLCGAVASGVVLWSWSDLGRLLLGMLLAGPILCGFSQVINDYFDRDVDAINEPNRLIPAGLISPLQVAATALALLLGGLLLASYFGRDVMILVAIGVFLAVAYSVPPLRAKRNGWIGNALVAISYEGLAWMAGSLVFGPFSPANLLLAALYSFGTHGIMTINDFKSIDGDAAVGIRTIPVIHGPKQAAWFVVLTMTLAQIVVIAAFVFWGKPVTVAILAVLLLLQLWPARKFLRQPVEQHLMFSVQGSMLFVIGMMVAAVGLRSLL